jgi:hypothetical protein
VPCGNQSAKVLDWPHGLVRKDFLNLLPNEVVEFADGIRGCDFQVDREFANTLLVLQAQPWGFGDLSPNSLNDFAVRLRSVLELVESSLELERELLSQIGAPGRDAGGFQISDRSDLVPFSLQRYLRQVPPGTLLLLEFVLVICPLFRIGKAVANKAWEFIALDHTNPVEVVVPAVAPGRLRMKGEGCFEAQLPFDHVIQYFCLAHFAA